MNWWMILIALWLAPALIVGAVLWRHVNREGATRHDPHAARNRTNLPPAE